MIIFDTNVYAAIERNEPRAVEFLKHADDTIALPLFCIAELRFGFKKGSRERTNEEQLTRFLAIPGISVLAPTMDTTSFYADASLYSEKNGRALSDTDRWIAALARQHDATIVTFDRDFLGLREILGKGLIVL